MQLSRTDREKIFHKTCRTVEKQYFDPRFNGKSWTALVEVNKKTILDADDPARFESAMHDLVRQLGTSHTGFFHQSVNRVPGRLAVCATFRKAETPQGLRWMFQDVHVGGPADLAGIRPLDILLAIEGQPIAPPQQPMFPMGTTVSVTLRKSDRQETGAKIVVPKPRTRRQPYAEPIPVISRKLDGGIGYLKATIFPGLLGIDVARSLDKAFADLSGCDRLIVDLRGNLGGGLGLLRLMSHLTPDRIPIGYSVTRKSAERGVQKESLRRFGWIPSSKLAIPLVALRHAGRDGSVVLMTEGLGPKRSHGRIVLLVNEHTVSAGEMITAFAAENKLATIVGTETAGRLLGGTGFKVGQGYLVILPKAAFYTWQGKSYEGHGIPPDVPIPWSSEAALRGTDNQLEKAIEVAKSH
ncbi:MAG TPA: S41 family peptidase [Terriglobia bacterium]|nr:S41 family peptidase [Terriglobia bacterium]